MKEIKKILVNGIKVQYNKSADYDEEAVYKASEKIKKETGCVPKNLRISKKSIDARREITFVYSVYAEVETDKKIELSDIKEYSAPDFVLEPGNEQLSERPVIVGFGPAGIFAGYLLAQYGYKPLIVERGASVGERVEAVERFIRDGILDTSTNIQFGAGGAGTFSDGKLTTRINDPHIVYVTEVLHKLGAPDDIMYKAKPHIGTDILRKVVENADREITRLGGEIRYKSKAENITPSSVEINGEKIQCGVVILACGHSARDTYGDLIKEGFCVEPKPFSVGVRIEHLQKDIDIAMYGSHAGDKQLGHAEYQLSWRNGERGCYTFCMCPGGEVVPSASEEGGVVTNGMSRHSRDGKNANAAVCVSVLPDDYGSNPIGAIEFQRNLERAAYNAGGKNYCAPMQTVGDFLNDKHGTEYSRIIPSYRNARVKCADFSKLFPPFVTGMLKSGLLNFGKKIKGYDTPDAPLTGVETRTSSPIRILRGENLCAIGHDGIYPCGEGAGYAGGIVSAAVDGLRVASKIITRYKPY